MIPAAALSFDVQRNIERTIRQACPLVSASLLCRGWISTTACAPQRVNGRATHPPPGHHSFRAVLFQARNAIASVSMKDQAGRFALTAFFEARQSGELLDQAGETPSTARKAARCHAPS